MRNAQIVVAGISLFMVGACAQEPTIGVLRPLTGQARVYGRAVDRGLQLALSEAQAGASLPQGFELHAVDTRSSPNVAVTEFRRMVATEGVSLVLGGITAEEAYALVPEIAKARIVCLSPSVSASELSRMCPYFYRMYPTDELEGRTAARHLYENLGVRSVVVYTDDSVHTRGTESRFRQHFELTLGGEVSATLHLGDEHWKKRSVDAIHAHQPDAVYVVGYAGRILDALQHLKEQSFKGARCTTSAFYVADVLEHAGDAAEGVMFPLTAFDVGSSQQPVQGFVQRYRERFGGDPDIYAAHGYDAMKVAIHALANAAALYTPEIKKSMQFNLRDFTGVTGAIAFDDHGEVKHYPVMHCVADGRVTSCASLARMLRNEVLDRLHEFQRLSARRGRRHGPLGT